MTDRLTNIIVGLQRLGEEARIKGEDIRYSQQQEDAEHLRYLKDLLAIVQKVHQGLINNVREFTPNIEEATPEMVNKLPQPGDKPMPKFLQQGPRKEAS